MDTPLAAASNTLPTRRDALLEIIDRTRDLERMLADFYDADARTAIGTVEVWAPKDHFAHLAVWQAYQARRIEALTTGHLPPQPAENDTVFWEHRDEPWETIWANAMRALDEDAAAVARLSDDALADPDRLPWTNGRSFVSSLISYIYLHPVEHLVQAYEERGDNAAAERAQWETVTTVARLFGKGEEYANAVYNLACFYAKRGRTGEAIAQVREALAVNPRLIEWSKADEDLASLHHLPDYQALYTA